MRQIAATYSIFPFSIHVFLTLSLCSLVVTYHRFWQYVDEVPQRGISSLLGVLLLNSWGAFLFNTTQSITFNYIYWQTESQKKGCRRLWETPGLRACQAAGRAEQAVEFALLCWSALSFSWDISTAAAGPGDAASRPGDLRLSSQKRAHPGMVESHGTCLITSSLQHKKIKIKNWLLDI